MARRTTSSDFHDQQAAQFSKLLADALHTLRITHRELAAALGVTVAAVDSWTSNASPRIPGAANLARLYALLDQHDPRVSQPLRRVLDGPVAKTIGPALHSTDPAATQHNLPTPLTRCIGRERELADIAAYFSGHRGSTPRRLLSLIGAGGIGKTRLALEAGRALRSSFADGVWLVELAALSDPALVAHAAASAIKLRPQANTDVTEALVDRLRDKHTLLIFDNCEHVVDACATLLAHLLSACPTLCVLATSREMLRLDGETVWRVPSLSVAAPGVVRITAKEALHQQAVQLFVDRARTVEREFALTDDNASLVAQICYRLDGVPLAIELAAANVHHLAVQDIAANLDDRFNLLTRGSRAALPRQQTLRATLDWSYSLLTDAERALFTQLAVFAGGADEEQIVALSATLAPSGQAPEYLAKQLAHTYATLRSLADKSLINSQRINGVLRYTLLESVRDYAREKLAETEDDLQRTRAAHLAVFTLLARQAEAELTGPNQIYWLERLAREIDNLRAALEGCVRSQKATDGLQLATALGWFWSLNEHELEGIRWLEQLLTVADADIAAGLQAQAHFFAGFLHWYLANQVAALPHLQRCLALWQAPQDAIQRAYSQIFVTQMQATAGQLSGIESMAHMDTYADVFRAAGDDWGLSLALGRAGSTALAEKDLARSMSYYEEAYAARQRAGLKRMWSSSLNNLGFTALCQRDFDRAKAFLQQAIVLGEGHNRAESVLMAQCNLGHIQFLQGDARAALDIFKRCVVRHQELGIRDHLIATLAGIAYATAALEIAPNSCILFGAVSRQMADLGVGLWWNERDVFDAGLEKLKCGLDAHTFATAWAQGQALSLAQTIELATKL